MWYRYCVTYIISKGKNIIDFMAGAGLHSIQAMHLTSMTGKSQRNMRTGNLMPGYHITR